MGGGGGSKKLRRRIFFALDKMKKSPKLLKKSQIAKESYLCICYCTQFIAKETNFFDLPFRLSTYTLRQKPVIFHSIIVIYKLATQQYYHHAMRGVAQMRRLVTRQLSSIRFDTLRTQYVTKVGTMIENTTENAMERLLERQIRTLRYMYVCRSYARTNIIAPQTVGQVNFYFPNSYSAFNSPFSSEQYCVNSEITSYFEFQIML